MDFLANAIQFENYTITYAKFDKFNDDKIFSQNTDYIIGIDGVVLNLQALKNQYAISDYFKLISNLFKKEGIAFASKLKGEFTGFIVDKKDRKLYYFNNKTATKQVFYTQFNDVILISSSLEKIIDIQNELEIKNSLNINATYNLLTYGAMIENQTLVNGIYKLNAGEYVIVKDASLKLNTYFTFNNIDYSIYNKKEAIDKLNESFLVALNLEYQKDETYNYNHLATLSGGLDSRMNVMIADSLGFKNDTFCFSQSGYLDEKIARSIAQDLELPFSFTALDGGDYMASLQEMVAINNGLQFYLGSAHFNFALKKMDLSNYGLMHTGQIGDGILGGFVTKEKRINSKFISKKLAHKTILDKTISTKYSNEEVFKLYQRVFNLTNYGSYVVEQHKTYIVSPFMDDDFIKIALSIDPKLKFQQQIYIDWIKKYHPNVNKYTWEKTGFRPNKNWKNDLSRYTKKIKKEYYKATHKTYKLSMTPLDYWYANNEKASLFYITFFNDNLSLFSTNKELYNDLRLLFTTGNTVEKSMVLTVLEMVRKFKLVV
ncbi:MAG: asparagine synthase-related protein [Flavobacteriaceae bacterium]